MSDTKIIVGLGNPGNEYNNTRHNVGFNIIDAINNELKQFSTKDKFLAHLASMSFGDYKIITMKPQTYMNESGQSIGAAVRFYKADLSDVIVIHDDIDLPFGTVKIKRGGGSAGHNGIKSVDSHIGVDYIRVRIGIGRPSHRQNVSNFVLGKFTKEENIFIQKLAFVIAKNIDLLIVKEYKKFYVNIA